MTNSKQVVIFFGAALSLVFYPKTFVFIFIFSVIINRFRYFFQGKECLLALFFLVLISFKNTFLPMDLKGDILGISFVLFQVCYFLKEDMSIYTLVTRLSFFPQMYCGPVVKPSSFERDKVINIQSLALYHVIFSVGLFYKAYITYITHYFYSNDNSIFYSIFWWAYMYSDFLSWSLMGIGIAGLSGFKLPISFKSPFFSKNLSQFYRRWNITIYQWCLDFIRMKKHSKFWAYANISIATASLALWHGLGVNFIIFGGLNFFYFLMQNRIKNQKKLLWFSQIFYYLFVGFIFNGFLPSNVLPDKFNWFYFVFWMLSVFIILFLDYKSFSLIKNRIRRQPFLIIVVCFIFVVFTLFFRKVDGQFYYAQF